MSSNYKTRGKALSMPMGLLSGVAAGLVLTLSISFLIAELLNFEKMKWENIGYGIMILIFSSSLVAAVISCSKIKRQTVVVCILAGTLYLCVLLSITALFFGGKYYAVGVTTLLIIAGAGTGGLLISNRNKGLKNKKVKYSPR